MQEGRDMFVKFLDDTDRIHIFKCLLAIKKFRSIKGAAEDKRRVAALDIVDSYISQESPTHITDLPSQLQEKIQEHISKDTIIPTHAFEQLWQFVLKSLLSYYNELSKSDQFKNFIGGIHSQLKDTKSKNFESKLLTQIPPML